MVFKVSKGGVRTGNTLRGLHSKRTKRYGQHACLLGCTSLGRRDFTRLINDSSDDNELVKETLGKTDVLLSLNKQQRWRLPAIISHMIKNGEFNKGATVSMLEKHKLKRRANCISLVSNNLKRLDINPKQKKYFSYKLDTIAEDQSNREKKRERIEAMKKMKLPKTKPSRSGVIHAFTSNGITASALPLIKSDKPEYRLEVFYPCPQSCSLTYNPKYTDVILAEGKTGEMEVKSNVKAEKKGNTTHRKRFNSRDLGYYDEDVDDDVEDMWLEDSKDDVIHETDEYQSMPSNHFSMENAVDMLLSQAKKTRDICTRRKQTHRRNSNEKPEMIKQNMSHIIYVEDESATENVDTIKTDEVITTTNYRELSFFKVILSRNEISAKELRNKFGLCYTEASCSPRRFVIDITDDIGNLMGTSKSSTKEIDFSSYLVFIHDGFYDEGLESYRITFNSLVQCDIGSLTSIIPFAQKSIFEIVNFVASHLLESGNLMFNSKKTKDDANKNDSTFLNSRIKMTVDVFNPSTSISKLEMSDEAERSYEVTSDDLYEESFCDVCYSNTTNSRIDSVSSTKLQECGHHVCDECWATHFRTKMREGKTEMTCVGYDCNTEVGIVTLVSILHATEVATLLQRKTEQQLQTMENAKWCPNPECGRVIKVNSKYNDHCVDVVCACGNSLCFNCFGPAHWPAKCDQAEEYRDKLPSIKPAKEYVEEEEKKIPLPPSHPQKKQPTVKIEGRTCPRCDRFIEKNGGCPNMYCKCGYNMCWTCMKPWHYTPCKIDSNFLVKHSKTLIVKHASSKQLPKSGIDDTEQKPAKIQTNRQKASLYQRALQQRDEVRQTVYHKTKDIIIKMTKESQRDEQFRTKIINTMKPKESEHTSQDLDTMNLTPLIKQFIRDMITMKKELHHVTEYTFILLQGTPNSLHKQSILKLANDLSGICSFLRSILDLQDKQDVKTAFTRLVDLREWAKRALDALIPATKYLRLE